MLTKLFMRIDSLYKQLIRNNVGLINKTTGKHIKSFRAEAGI